MNNLEIESAGEAATTRNMARLFFATFWLVVFTGAVRKWIFPNSVIFYLLQDVPIFFAYLFAIRSGMYGRGLIFLSVMFLSAIITIQGLLQIIIIGTSPVVVFVGLHNYLFYFPMLFIFPFCLTEKFRRDFLRWSLLLNIPMCVLAIAQNASPRNAWINKTSEGEAFGVPGADVARVSGTFNFVSFYAVWVGLSIALCLGEWLLPSWRRAFRSRGLLLASTVSIILCALISASRGAIMLAAVAVLGIVVGALLLRSNRVIVTIAGCILLMPLGVVATYYLSPAEFNIVLDRFTSDSGSQDIYDRIGSGVLGFVTEPPLSLVGAGVGMGVDASHIGSANSYAYTYALSEVDLTRTVMELGTPVGLIYAVMRLCFAVCMVLISFRILLSGSSPHVLPLSFFLFIQLYFGDLTRSATMDSTFAMIAASYILGVFFNPDRESIAPDLVQIANGAAYGDTQLPSLGKNSLGTC